MDLVKSNDEWVWVDIPCPEPEGSPAIRMPSESPSNSWWKIIAVTSVAESVVDVSVVCTGNQALWTY